MNCGCCNGMNEGEYAWSGSGLKFAVSMTCDGFDMNQDDWTITVTRGTKKIEFTPANAVHETVEVDEQEQENWYICIDTTDLGPGEMNIIFDAYVPDDNFEGGIRHEIQKYRLINIKSL